MKVIVKYIFIEKQKVVLFPKLRENQREMVACKNTSSIALYVIFFPMFRKNFRKSTKPYSHQIPNI